MAKEYMLRSDMRDCQSNVIAGRVVGLSLALEANTDLTAGMIVSLNSERDVHGIVSDGQSTLPFRREGVEKCGYSVCCSS